MRLLVLGVPTGETLTNGSPDLVRGEAGLYSFALYAPNERETAEGGAPGHYGFRFRNGPELSG